MTISKLIRQGCLAGLVVIAAGCTASDEAMKLSDGSMGYHIYCGGLPYKSKDDCFVRADMMCENGYTVLQEGDPAYPHKEFIWGNGTHDIIVRCNNSPKN